MKRFFLIAAVMFQWSWMGQASANSDEIAYGEYLSGTCVTCHQKSGEDKGIPPIVGWDVEAFVAVMQSYKTKERENEVMINVAVALSDEEIKALAAYFATLKPKDE